MPNRKIRFLENSYYHVFNRGVEKRIIFLDKHDYSVFCDILAYYLTFTKNNYGIALHRTGDACLGFYKDKIKLLAYCLMPNHFHLLLYQSSEVVLSDFVRRVSVAYVMYFNDKYERVGSLFQGRFNAKFIGTDEYLLQVNKYIHRNPISLARPGLVDYPWSSYSKYLKPDSNHNSLSIAVDSKPVLDYFSSANISLSYKEYVEMIPQTELQLAEIASY